MNTGRVVAINPSPEFDPTIAHVDWLRDRHPALRFDRDATGAEIVVGWPTPDQVATRGLEWVQIPSVGFDRLRGLDLAASTRLTNARGVFSQAIAEHALALALALTRDIPRHVRQHDRGQWHKRRDALELAGTRALVAGTGTIGRAVARLLAGFVCRVIGVSRSGAAVDGFDEVRDRLPDAAELGSFSLLVLALPGTARTSGFLHAGAIAALGSEAVVVNVGRGDAIDEIALVDALANGRIRGAGLDVARTEPPTGASPLWLLENVVLSSHSAGSSPRRTQRFLELLDDNLTRFVAGRPLRNRIDRAAGY